jgi:pilus assembly protein Flp/PilA
MRQMRQFLFSRAGATAVEYAMIAALVSVVIITGAATLGAALNTKFEMVGDRVSAVAPN